jgi:hypothetical protein
LGGDDGPTNDGTLKPILYMIWPFCGLKLAILIKIIVEYEHIGLGALTIMND